MKRPWKKSRMKLKDRVHAQTSRLDGRSWRDIVADVIRNLRGWHGYFQHNGASTFSAMDAYVRRRLRSLLQWRLDGVGEGRGAAHQRWPNEWFAHGGLLSLAAEHLWMRTIIKLRTH